MKLFSDFFFSRFGAFAHYTAEYVNTHKVIESKFKITVCDRAEDLS